MTTAVARIVAEPTVLNVPNHLLDTQLFPSHATLSNVLAVDKQTIHFRGYQLGKVHKQRLALTNKANGARRMHIIAPASGYFKIRFKKTGKLMPGMSLSVTVEFCTNEFNIFEDFIKIHCEDRHNLVIPLHAYPVLDMMSFPKAVSFSNTPVCKSVNKKIRLTSPVPVDFLFKLQYSGHPSLNVGPTSGIIPGEGTIELKITFCPSEYITANGYFDLMIQQYDNPVYSCQVTGLCQPGTERDIVFESDLSGLMPTLSGVRKTQKLADPLSLDPSTLTPLARSKKPRKVSRDLERTGTIVNGVRFPENLDNPAAVAFVLNQTPGQLNARELRSGSAAATIAKQVGNERQLKCAVFESIVKQKALEERNNKLRWTTHLGSAPVSSDEEMMIITEREKAHEEYLLTQAIFKVEEEFKNEETICLPSRIYRLAHEHTELVPTFDPYTSSEWGKRKLALTRFIRAVRKVVVQQRVAKRFRAIKGCVKKAKVENGEIECKGMKQGEVTPVYLPLYHQPSSDRDMAPVKLGDLAPPSVSLQLEIKYPLFDLHVPKSSEILGYQEHEINFTAVYELHSTMLRVGAEDEITAVLQQTDMLVETLPQPPPSLLHHTEYPPLMIFNPAPNLKVQCPASGYLETGEEYYLDPLLRRPIKHRGPLQPLHKQDVIQGSQRWNKFPCQMLVSLNHMDTIGSVWCHRREALITRDMVEEVPELLTGISDDLEVLEDDTVLVAYPTPADVARDFVLEFEFTEPDSLPTLYTSHNVSGPVHRTTRIDQLECSAHEKQDQLGSTIHRKLNSLQDSIRDKHLHLDMGR